MQTTGTIFLQCPVEGELFVSHLPAGQLSPGNILSLPCPEQGEWAVTFMPEEGSYLPMQRKLRFRDSRIVSPVPDGINAQIWPSRMNTAEISPIRVPRNFSVYPEILEERDTEFSGRPIRVSRIRREVQTLLISEENNPLAEFPLPPSAVRLEEILLPCPNVILIPVVTQNGRTALILRREPTGWHRIGEYEMLRTQQTQDAFFLFTPCPESREAEIRVRITPEDVRSELILTADTPEDPGILILHALHLQQTDLVQRLLAPDLSAADLERYLGSFSRILPPPVTLPLDDGCSAWGMCGQENPAEVRLYVFEANQGRILNIYQWE